MSYAPHVEQHITELASVQPEYARACIKLVKYVQNFTKQELEMPIQKAMCDAWDAHWTEKEKLECVLKAVIRQTRGQERTGAHAERHWQWGSDNYLHRRPVAATWPNPLVNYRASQMEKQIAETMTKAKQRMINNWQKQKAILEKDMWAVQDAQPKYADGDMSEPPTQEELRSNTKKVLALHGLSDVRGFRSPERTVTTETRTRARTPTSWTRASTWTNPSPVQPDTEEPSSASDTSWKDNWKGHRSWGRSSAAPWR